MITTVTLNVAIDKAYIVDRLDTGEVIRVKKSIPTPGGKGLNVARVVNECEEDVLATGLVGGYGGAYVKEMLDKKGLYNDFLNTSVETRTCINILDNEGNSTELLEPGENVSEEEYQQFINKFKTIIDKSEVVTFSGSVPQGIPRNAYKELIAMAKEKEKKVILDTSGDLLVEGIKAQPTLIKPNLEEVQKLVNLSGYELHTIKEAAVKLQQQGIPYVVVSLGKNGALLASEQGVFHGKSPHIEPLNTVGSGDSMVAAFAVAMKRKYSVEKMLKYAISVSAANTLTITTGSFNKEDQLRIFNQVKVSRL